MKYLLIDPMCPMIQNQKDLYSFFRRLWQCLSHEYITVCRGKMINHIALLANANPNCMAASNYNIHMLNNSPSEIFQL